jgi:hypothetical protein
MTEWEDVIVIAQQHGYDGERSQTGSVARFLAKELADMEKRVIESRRSYTLMVNSSSPRRKTVPIQVVEDIFDHIANVR